MKHVFLVLFSLVAINAHAIIDFHDWSQAGFEARRNYADRLLMDPELFKPEARNERFETLRANGMNLRRLDDVLHHSSRIADGRLAANLWNDFSIFLERTEDLADASVFVGAIEYYRLGKVPASGVEAYLNFAVELKAWLKQKGLWERHQYSYEQARRFAYRSLHMEKCASTVVNN